MTLILEHHFYLLMPKTLYIFYDSHTYTPVTVLFTIVRNENGFVAIHCFELNRGYWRVAVLVHLSHSALLRIHWQPDGHIYLVLECRSNKEYRDRDRTPTRRKLNIILSFNQIISFWKIICGILDKVLLFHSIYRTYFSKYHIKTNVTQTSAFVPYLYIYIYLCVYSTGRMKRTFRILYYYFSGYNPNKLIGDKQNNQLSFRTMLLLWQPWRCE